MADKLVRVGILQIGSHPAAIVGDVDLLSEPFLPRQQSESISLLARRHVDVRACLDAIRDQYILWQRRRLEFLFRWLKQIGPPRVLALPECSVPFDVLDVARDFVRETDSVVLAGTHTLRRGDSAFADYRRLGVREQNCKDVLKSTAPYASVLPIVWRKETVLHAKAAPSIFELTDLDPNTTTPVNVRTIPVGSPKISIATLVCAEALRLPSYPTKKPDLAFIVARERQPQRFNPHVQMLTANRIPVALANDARFGGSFIRTAIDERVFAWWFASPLNGLLPIGEFYLEAEVNIGNPVVQVGVSAPPTTARLLRLVPIFPDGSSELDVEHKLLAAAKADDAAGVDALLREYSKDDSGLQLARWRFVATAIRNRTLTSELLNTVGEHLATPGISSLDALEQDLARAAQVKLDRTLNDTPGLSDELYGQIYRTIRGLRERSSMQQEDPGGPLPSVLPIGRSGEISDLRNFATKGKDRLFLLTGLEGIGKSAIAAAALGQAGTRQVRVCCVPGISADTIFEYLIRSGDRIASGYAPRTLFPKQELAEALRRFDVIWIENGHHLLEGPSWRTAALDALVHGLIGAAAEGNFRVLLESRRRMPLILETSERVAKRQIRGLPDADAVAFFESHLHRAGIDIDALYEDNILSVVRLVAGHPGLLALCAELRHEPVLNRLSLILKRVAASTLPPLSDSCRR